MHSNFEDLLEDYFTAKIPAHKGERYSTILASSWTIANLHFVVAGGNCVPSQKAIMFSSPTDKAAPEADQLQEFAGGLKNFTKFCARPVSTLI